MKATGEGLGFELGNTEFAISGGTGVLDGFLFVRCPHLLLLWAAHQTSPAHEGVASLQDQALLCMGQLSLLVPLCPSALLLQPR